MKLKTLAIGLAALTTGLAGAATLQEQAKNAFLYAYPMVLMEVTKDVSTATVAVDPKAMRAPVNQFVHLEQFPTPEFKTVVSPNVDTLYSSAFLDLTKEPIVLSLPQTDRYYLMPMLDAYTDVFASPGTRTTGNRAGNFVIVGPDFRGRVPRGMRTIYASTNTVWIIGRTQTNGNEDIEHVRGIQKNYRLTPLSAWGSAFTPPREVPVRSGIDLKTPPSKQVEAMSAETFFRRFCYAMKVNPPAKADRRFMATLGDLGIHDRGCTLDLLREENLIALKQGMEEGLRQIAASSRNIGGSQKINGWNFDLNLGNYGTNYLLRAAVAMVGLGANLAEDAVYTMARLDSDGNPLNGTGHYVLRFDRGKLPPVNAFWSVTMYDESQSLVKNVLERYALGSKDKLKVNEDGSVELYFQQKSPGADKESNWLPTPAGNFNVILRMYWPRNVVLNKRWVPPAIQRVQ